MEGSAFQDRASAGAELARELQRLKLPSPLIVLGLPRGGVPVAYEVARALHASLDVLPVRKVGMPGQPEVAIGAVAVGDVVVHEPAADRALPQLRTLFDRLARTQRRELQRRERLYRNGLPAPDLQDRTVVLVDDGLATGCTDAGRRARGPGGRGRPHRRRCTHCVAGGGAAGRGGSRPPCHPADPAAAVRSR